MLHIMQQLTDIISYLSKITTIYQKMLVQLLVSFLFLVIFPLIFIFYFPKSKNSTSPKPLPIIGNYFDVKKTWNRRVQWTSEILANSPSATFVLHSPFGGRTIITGYPATVQHILRTKFHQYHKGPLFRSALFDFLGNGIFNADGDTWKIQRQIASHEFNTKSLRKFVETVVDTELFQRLIPILSSAAAKGTVLDFQNILQRFAFDNICKIAFGYDPGYLSPSLPPTKFADAFEDSVRISSNRFNSLFWKIERAFGFGSEKRLKEATSEVRDFALNIVKEKKEELKQNSSLESADLLSRFLSSGHSDETFVTDIVISFILAGRDTTSAALTWFFWLLSKNTEAEAKILEEIKEKSEHPMYEEVKDMVYTHASLCESMRLYPPVPTDSKFAIGDDVLPDGTRVTKGNEVTYHPYAMGRLEMIWGSDWADFKPERWLEKDASNENWNFVGKDSYTYPVFQAGPRICLGKEMAFLQMKRVVAGVLNRFKVVPVGEDGFEPEFVSNLTTKMKGGFPVKIVDRSK